MKERSLIRGCEREKERERVVGGAWKEQNDSIEKWEEKKGAGGWPTCYALSYLLFCIILIIFYAYSSYVCRIFISRVLCVNVISLRKIRFVTPLRFLCKIPV